VSSYLSGGPCGPLLLPTRSRESGSGSFLSQSGVTAAEILAALAIAAALIALIAPGAAQLQASVSMRSAASETAAAFTLARAYAVRHGVTVGLKFRKNGDRYEWTLYRDGNGNGLRTAEIDRGIDRPIGVSFPWTRWDVKPGILRDTPVPDPSNPGRFLARPDDPIRFNSSDICSFSPVGESTPGSVYLWDGKDRMGVVRVYGRSAKVRSLYHRRGEVTWKP
jgi:type II secretion system GspH-like protein